MTASHGKKHPAPSETVRIKLTALVSKQKWERPPRCTLPARYLQKNGVRYIHEFKEDNDILKRFNRLCHALLKSDKAVHQDPVFHNGRFKLTCEKIKDRNDARVVKDIGRLIVPSVETFATCGATTLMI